MPTKDDRWRTQDLNKREDSPSEEKSVQRDRTQQAVMEDTEDLEDEGRAPIASGESDLKSEFGAETEEADYFEEEGK